MNRSDVAPETPPAPPRARPRGLWIALIASAAVNLLAIGLALGLGLGGLRLYHPGSHAGGHEGAGRGASPDDRRPAGSADRFGPAASVFSARAFLAAMPPEKRAPLLGKLRAHVASNRALGAEARAARAAAIDAMKADPFDPAAAREALARYRAAQEKVQALTNEFLVEIAAVLTPEERAAIIAAAEQRGRVNAGVNAGVWPGVWPGGDPPWRRGRVQRQSGDAPSPPE